MPTESSYDQIIKAIFNAHFKPGDREVVFARSEIAETARRLKLAVPKNLGDLVYTFRYRRQLPADVRATAPAGVDWIIRPAGPGMYRLALTKLSTIEPTAGLAETAVPGATPGIISLYALGDEQALLATIRYNRLVDIFTGVTCYSLQNHLRTSLKGVGQVETDELYVGVDRQGTHYAIPVQAKRGTDILSVIQIEQDFALCAEKFADLVAKPVAAQFMTPDLVALFEFELDGDGEVVVSAENHYRLTGEATVR